MAELIGGIGASHAPSILHAYDQGKTQEPHWKSLFDAYDPVRAWLSAKQVDTLVVTYNDHLNHFDLGAIPTFALGVGAQMKLARDGRHRKGLPPVDGNPGLAAHMAESLVRDEFDLTICHEMELDHGVMTTLPLLVQQRWNVKVVPLAVNVVQEPLPTPRRCAKLGEAIRKAVCSYPGSERVVVVATGGLSHQLHGPDFGETNPDWDNRFLDLILTNPEPLVAASHEDYMTRGGVESVEMMMWLVMRMAVGANTARLRQIQRHYSAPLLTGYALLALECENSGL